MVQGRDYIHLVNYCFTLLCFLLGGEVLQEDDEGIIMQQHMQGTAEDARFRVRSFFDDLRETVNRQEEAGLAVVDNYVREKLFSLRQQQEDMAVLISQVNSVCFECEKSLQRTDAEVRLRCQVTCLSGRIYKCLF